jgi:hypothetical protein
MKTIEIYEKSKTSELKKLLIEFEEKSEKNELIMDYMKSINKNCDDLQKLNDDYEIDISLIRMELTKRLWYNKN